MIGINNSIYEEICMPRLTTLDNKIVESSEISVGFLLEGLEGNIRNFRYMVNAEIIEREST